VVNNLWLFGLNLLLECHSAGTFDCCAPH